MEFVYTIPYIIPWANSLIYSKNKKNNKMKRENVNEEKTMSGNPKTLYDVN